MVAGDQWISIFEPIFLVTSASFQLVLCVLQLKATLKDAFREGVREAAEKVRREIGTYIPLRDLDLIDFDAVQVPCH